MHGEAIRQEKKILSSTQTPTQHATRNTQHATRTHAPVGPAAPHHSMGQKRMKEERRVMSCFIHTNNNRGSIVGQGEGGQREGRGRGEGEGGERDQSVGVLAERSFMRTLRGLFCT